MTRFLLASAGAAALLCCATPGSHAQTYGDAPWCAVVSLGPGDIQWDCQYRTVEECVPHVLAGNRGSCNVNPYWRGGYAAPAVAAARPRRHHPR